MALSTGAKIALGCGCVVLLAGAAVVGVVGVGAFWAKSKVTEMKGGLDKIQAKTEEIERWEKQAQANAYTAPADGVISEARLLKFLDARKQVFAVYQKYEPQFKEIQAKHDTAGKEVTFTDAMSGLGKVADLFAEVRLTQMKALAEAGMNPDEYRDIQMAVYKSAWAAESMKSSGKLPSEAVAEGQKQMQEAMRKGMAEAEKQGVPGAAMSEEQQKQLAESMGKLGEAAKALDAPKANVELFRKYEADIKKYAMNGLEFIGL
jgi:general stress protein YciG